ncbi:MAG: alpha-ribazole phosphatase [Candidatus Omnitrophica bacterium]|nr:alpha-ribazole phosphatase [Candidatus Omnitrophota bacterium]
MPKKLILIRHGQTDWNYQKRYTGFTDIGLNKKGKAQARRLSKKLSKVEIHNVYASNMKRTVQFAKIIFKDKPVKEFSGLREMNFGILEGLTYQEIMKKHSQAYTKWLANPSKHTIPEGENLNNFAKRVRKTLKTLLSDNKNKTIAIFTHAGPIKVILCDILKISLRETWRIEPKSGSINIIEFTRGKARIHSTSNTAYLNG